MHGLFLVVKTNHVTNTYNRKLRKMPNDLSDVKLWEDCVQSQTENKGVMIVQKKLEEFIWFFMFYFKIFINHLSFVFVFFANIKERKTVCG